MLRKKWLALLVAISMVAAMMPTAAFADTETDTTKDQSVAVDQATDETADTSSDDVDVDDSDVDVDSDGAVASSGMSAANAIAAFSFYNAGEEDGPQTLNATPEDFEEKLKEANEGATIVLAAGEYNLTKDNSGYCGVGKQVNIKGAGKGETIIKGAGFAFAFGDGDVTVSDLTMVGEGTGTALNFQGSFSADGVTAQNSTYTVSNCAFEGYTCTIGVNSYTQNSELVLVNCEFNDVDYAAGIQGSNEVTMTDTTINDGYAVQYFTSGMIGYYPTYAEYEADKKAGSYNPPVQDGNGNHVVYNVEGLNAVLGSVQNGDTIILAPGEYDIGTLTLVKPVNVVGAGADKTVLNGKIEYAAKAIATGDESITIEGVKLVGVEGANDKAIRWSIKKNPTDSGELEGYTLNVKDCVIENFNYGTTLDTNAKKCTLNVVNTVFDTWCAVSVKDSDKNDYTLKDVTTDGATFAVQEFNSTSKEDKYYFDQDRTGYVDATQNTVTEGVDFVEVASIGNAYYNSLQDAVKAAKAGDTINLLADVTLTAPVQVPDGADITIIGNNHTVKFPAGGAFSNKDGSNRDGLTAGTKLDIQGVNFENTAGTSQGYAVIVGFDSADTEVVLNECTFTNMYCAVLANPFTDAEQIDKAPKISISNSKFSDTTYGYSIDEMTTGAVAGAVKPVFTGNEDLTGNMVQSEPWANIVLTQDGISTVYASLSDAVKAAKDGDTITLGVGEFTVDQAIVLDKKLTIQGSGEGTVINGTYKKDYGNGLFTFTGDSEGSVLKDMTIKYKDAGAQQAVVYFDYGFAGNSPEETTKIQNIHFYGGENVNDISNAIAISSTYTEGGYVEVSGCEIKNFKYGMYFNGIHDLTISGNTIDGTMYNAINIAGDNETIGCNNISIVGNTLTNISAGNYNGDEYSSGIRIGLNTKEIALKDNNISMLYGKKAIYFDPAKDGENPSHYIVTVMSDGVELGKYVVGDSFVLPAAPSKSGYTFLGWNDGVRTYNAGATVTLSANTTFTAQWKQNSTASSSDEGTSESTTTQSTTTTTQSGSNIPYYTCKACGYHDWTATAEGYKCDHCGYIESVKQLSGYGNVKGLYEPKTSSAAAQSASGTTATSAIPQTSDASNPMLWAVLLMISGGALASLAVFKKKKEN